MNDREQQEEALFEAARRLTDPRQRTAFLDAACAGNPALRKQLEDLLAAQGDAEDLFRPLPKPAGVAASPAVAEPASPPAADEQVGTMVGRYKLLQKIGEGGFGVVYLADQKEPVKRRVALKIIKLGMDTKQVVARFEAERQALALMDHPNIAKIYDGGVTGNPLTRPSDTLSPIGGEGWGEGDALSTGEAESQIENQKSQISAGRPYFVMELVRGVPITHYCDENQLSTGERLHLFLQICHAVQHAHQKGIIHRDLKPSNLLVTINDGVAVPKVIDFGIAKATQQELTEKTIVTQFHHFIGTPAYISPEQALMTSLDIDTRSDIYALGVLLYELLTGKTPFDGKELLASGLDEMRRTIREKEPPRPSTRLSTMVDADRTTTARLRKSESPQLVNLLRGDLDWIVMKCLEKDRTRRYETANGLASDIQRHLNTEPVVARPPSAAYRFQKLVRRNKLAFAAGAAVVVALVMGLGLAAIGWRQTRIQRDKARQAQQETEAARAGEEAQRREAQLAQGVANKQARKASESQEQSRRLLYASDMNLAQQSLKLNNLGRAQTLLNRQRPQAGQQDLRGWEWRYLWSQTRADEHEVFWNGPNRMYRIAGSADGRLLAFADYARELTVVDLVSRRTVLKEAGVIRLAFAHHAPLLAFGQDGISSNSSVVLWDTANQREIRRLPQQGWVREIAFLPNDTKLLTVSQRPSSSAPVAAADELPLTLSAWDVSSGKLLWQRSLAAPETGDVGHPFAVSPDGTSLADAIPGGQFQVLDTESGNRRFSVKATLEKVAALAFSADGKAVVSSACWTDSVLHIWDADNGTHLGSLEGHRSWVTDLVFTSDGSRLISASADQTIRLWDWPTRKPSGILRGHLNEVDGVTVSPDGRTVASHCKDGSIYLWDVAHSSRHLGYQTLPSRLRLDDRRAIGGADTSADSDATFTPDSQSILGVERGGAVVLWDAQTLKETLRLRGNSTNQSAIILSPDARRVVVRDAGGRLHVRDVHSGLESTNFITAPGTYGMRFTDDGNYLITFQRTATNEVADVWESDTWQRKGSIITKPEGLRTALTASLPNSLVLVADGVLRFFDVARLDQAPRLIANPGGDQVGRFNPGGFSGLAVSPDGRIAAGSFEDGSVWLWDMATLQPLDTLKGFLLGVHSVALSPDGKRLAGGSNGQEAVKLWDADTREEMLTLSGEGSLFLFLKFSPDGRFLLALNAAGVAHVWTAPSWEEIAAAEREAEKNYKQ